jgi:hypothetical protein
MAGGILALDQATVTGWAYSDPGDKSVQFGHQRMGRQGGTAGEVGAAFAIFLEARIAVFEPRWIVYEAPYVPRPSARAGVPPINPETLRRLLGLAFLIDTIAEQHGIDCREATSGAFIKFFTGSGKYPERAAKKAATVAMCKIHGWKATEDEADALALLFYAEAKLFPEFSMKRAAGPLFANAAGD